MSKLHFSGLNGLRAIAASGVLVRHLNADLEVNQLISFSTRNDLAGYGVTLFFVLSGYLITYLLMLEKAATNTVSIKKFYIRRLLRIWPLYYLYLLIALVCIYFFAKQEWQWWLVPLYLFMLPNFTMISGANPSNLINHYWTLGVEEQFYLFWPVLIKWSKNILRTLFLFTAIYFTCKVAVTLLSSRVDLQYLKSFFYYNKWHCMALGGMASVLAYNKHPLFFRIVTSYITQVAGWLALVLVIINGFYISNTINHEVFSIVAIILIVNVSQNKFSMIKLENKIWNFLGKISYGIYVIHPLCIFLCGKLFYQIDMSGTLKLILIYVSVITSTLCLAYFSYTYFESWFIRKKKKFTIIESRA